ncbi:hypothetical protein BDN72DRAFT_836234, partial [Pluteus cervinus]
WSCLRLLLVPHVHGVCAIPQTISTFDDNEREPKTRGISLSSVLVDIRASICAGVYCFKKAHYLTRNIALIQPLPLCIAPRERFDHTVSGSDARLLEDVRAEEYEPTRSGAV